MASAAFQYPLSAAGTMVRVLQWGLEGPVVLFLHGLGSHAEVWSSVAPILAEGRRCVAVDLPGHGLSSKGSRFAYTLDGHVTWLAALIDALGERQVSLVASSLGALWAAGFATRHPARIRTLTLLGGLGLAPLAPERRRWTADNLSRMDRHSVAERLRRAVTDPAVIDEVFIEEAFRMNNSEGARDSFAALARYYLEQINEDMQLARLIELGARCRLLLIWGREDRIAAYGEACEAAKRIAGCTLLSLNGIGHIPHRERPGAVCWALSHHLAERPLPAGPIEAGEIAFTGSEAPMRSWS
jgi:pimeloyl-ACP methyl ester carboxylesterase